MCNTATMELPCPFNGFYWECDYKNRFWHSCSRGQFYSKECVAVSIDICPLQDPMQFGIKVPGTPCGAPECRWDFMLIGSLEANLWAAKVTRWIKYFPQHMKLHHYSYISMSFLQHILVENHDIPMMYINRATIINPKTCKVDIQKYSFWILNVTW